jgi:Restriction endonuclease
MNAESPPVFVWRSLAEPSLGMIRGKCTYCHAGLTPRRDPHAITKGKIEQSQLGKYGKLLHEMTEIDWAPFRKIAQEYNATEAGQTHSMPEDLDDEIELFFGVLMRATHGLCQRCGWWLDCLSHNHGAEVTRTACASLRTFDLNSAELALPELRSHLSRHFTDVYSLAPRRFEEVVGSLYSTLGWNVVLTKQSRDGGFDLYCLGNPSGDLCLVECKRYASSRSISVGVVDRLLGVAFRNGAKQAHFVTTSKFTQPAQKAAQSARGRDLVLNLIDAHELASLFKIYSDPDITVKDVKAIFNSARESQL